MRSIFSVNILLANRGEQIVKYFDLFGLVKDCGSGLLQRRKPKFMEDEKCARPSADAAQPSTPPRENRACRGPALGDIGWNWVDIGSRGGGARLRGQAEGCAESPSSRGIAVIRKANNAARSESLSEDKESRRSQDFTAGHASNLNPLRRSLNPKSGNIEN